MLDLFPVSLQSVVLRSGVENDRRGQNSPVHVSGGMGSRRFHRRARPTFDGPDMIGTGLRAVVIAILEHGGFSALLSGAELDLGLV